MQKISGGNTLQCGHAQVISAFRYAAYQAGLNQRPVWCVECNGWVNILPAPITAKEEDEEKEEETSEVDKPNLVVLEFPEDE